MRSKNAFKNLAFYLTYEVFVFILGLIFPRFIILTYGSAINGLASTITRILSLINLIQAGAVGAAIYQMYKPVAENDYETQSTIIYSSKRFYKLISFVYFILSIIAAIFYSFYLRSDSLDFFEIFLAFLILSINGACVLLFNSIADIYISPHQKKYYLTISLIIGDILKYSLLSIVLIFKVHFLFIYASYLVGGLSSALLQFVFYKSMSKGKINNNPKCKNYKIPNRKYLMLSSIGGEAVTASPPIIISTIIDLVASSVFSIYSMIFTSMKTILSSIQLSFSAIFGNLVKTSDENHIYKVYSTIELITLSIGTVCGACVGFLIIPFICLYTRGITDADYLYPILAVFVVFYVLIFAFRTSFSYVATVYGLFKYTCNITLIFGGIGIILSIICVLFFGMPYVMVGLLFNQISCSIATIIILKRKITWFKISKLVKRSLIMVSISVFSSALFYLINPQITSWIQWISYGCLTVFIILVILLIYISLFEREQMNLLLKYIKNLYYKKNNKEKK